MARRFKTSSVIGLLILAVGLPAAVSAQEQDQELETEQLPNSAAESV